MKLLSYQNIYFPSNSKSVNSPSFFLDTGSERSHLCAKFSLNKVSPYCHMVVIAIDENKELLPLSAFEYFNFTLSLDLLYAVQEQFVKQYKVFVGPPVNHVKEFYLAFRPKFELRGKSIQLRVGCFENNKSIGWCETAPKSICISPLMHPRVHKKLGKNGIWERIEDEDIDNGNTVMDIDYFSDMGLLEEVVYGNNPSFGMDTDTLQSKIMDCECTISTLKDTISTLKDTMSNMEEKFFEPKNCDEAKRCSDCFDVIEFPYLRSVFWVNDSTCFYKFHCRRCCKKPKECRRRLLAWYTKDDHAHDTRRYAERAVFTNINAQGKCNHATLEELAEEFDEYL